MRATPGVVDVWSADLTAAADRLGDLLCAEEHERARRLRGERARRLWIGSRGVLRALLARYLESDPRALRFVLGEHGKPALRERAAPAADLRFNLSHSDTMALYAVTVGREVGVDIERARERYTAEFLRGWVAREATVKCRGTGLATPSEGSPKLDLWTAALDVGPLGAAAVAVEQGRCELRCWQWRG